MILGAQSVGKKINEWRQFWMKSIVCLELQTTPEGGSVKRSVKKFSHFRGSGDLSMVMLPLSPVTSLKVVPCSGRPWPPMETQLRRATTSISGDCQSGKAATTRVLLRTSRRILSEGFLLCAHLNPLQNYVEGRPMILSYVVYDSPTAVDMISPGLRW